MKAETYSWPATSAKSDATPFGAWGAHAASSEADEIAAMQQQTAQRAQQVKDTERRILAKVEETRQIGTSTLSELHGQREQLGRVAAAQDEVHANLATSDRLLRGMESWRGAMVNAVTGWFGGSSETPRAGQGESGRAMPRAAGADAVAGGAAASAPLRPSPAHQQPAPSELDTVGQISQVVSDLRAQADQMNAELRGQSATLDGLQESADRNAAYMQRNVQRTRALR